MLAETKAAWALAVAKAEGEETAAEGTAEPQTAEAVACVSGTLTDIAAAEAVALAVAGDGV